MNTTSGSPASGSSAPAVAAVSRDVSFAVAGTTTYGTLDIPAHRYPPSVAARLTSGSRVLITDCTADTNVPVSTIRPLAAALTAAGATGPGLRVLAGVNHLLHLPGVSNNTRALAPSAVAALQEWANPSAAAPAS